MIGGYGAVHGHDFRSPPLVRLGAYGVHLFFIISGFVILMTIEHKASAREFIVARVGRLYPTYWTAVLLTSAIIAAGAVPNHTVSGRQVLANLTMFQLFMKVEDVDGAYRTLSYELAFYALMLFVMRTRLSKHIEIVSVVWMGIGAAYTLAMHAGLVGLHARVQTILVVAYCHLFVAGMMFYRLRTTGEAWHRHGIIACVAVFELANGNRESFAMVVLFLAVFYAATYDKVKFIAVRPLVFLGRVSYALYAIHETAGTAALLALRRVGVGSRTGLAIAVPALVALAWVITAVIERPANRWINLRGRQAMPP